MVSKQPGMFRTRVTKKLLFSVGLSRDFPVYPRHLMNLSRDINALTRDMPNGLDTISVMIKFKIKLTKKI